MITLEAIEALEPRDGPLVEQTPIGPIDVTHVVSRTGQVHRWRVRHGRGLAHYARSTERAWYYVRQSRLAAGVPTDGSSKRPNDPTPDAVEDPCLVSLDPVDAMAVGLSLRTLARQQQTPRGTADFYARVGRALVDAAQQKLTERNRGRT